MKFSTLPPFKATGKVAVYRHGDLSPTTWLTVQVYATDAWAIGSAMERSAKWALEHMGMAADAVEKLCFEYHGTDELAALEPRGIKQVFGESVEGFFDAGQHMQKRATLIRQRRLLPHDHADAMAIYGTPAIKLKAARKAARAEGVAA